jgi:hypothetical protein
MNLLPDFIREKAIAFAVSKAGKYAVTAVNAAVSAAITAGLVFAGTKLATFDSTLAVAVSAWLRSIDQAKLAEGIFIVVASAIHWVTVHYLTKDSRAIQDGLQRAGFAVDVDGWIGPKSVEAFANATGIPVRKAEQIEEKKADEPPTTGGTAQPLSPWRKQ